MFFFKIVGEEKVFFAKSAYRIRGINIAKERKLKLPESRIIKTIEMKDKVFSLFKLIKPL